MMFGIMQTIFFKSKTEVNEIMMHLHRRNLTKELIDVFIYDKVSFFSTTEGKKIDIQDLCHMALRFGSNKIFRHALAMGAHPDIKDSEGHSALYNVVYGVSLDGYRCQTANLAEMFKTLMTEHKCDPRGEAEDLLHIAANQGLNDIVKILIDDLKINVDIKDSSGRTPLFEAVRNERISTARMLLEHGANANALLDNGMSPLWAAAYVKYPRGAMFDLLIEFKADPTICHQGTKLVSYLWSQGERNGHADIIKRLKLDPAYVSAAIEEQRALKVAERKKQELAVAARKEAKEAALKKVEEAVAVPKQAQEAAAACIQSQEAPAVPKPVSRVSRNRNNNANVTPLKKIYNFMKRPSLVLGVVGATIVAAFGTMSPLWVFVGTFLVAEGVNRIRERLAKRAWSDFRKSSVSPSYHEYFREGVRAQNDNWEYAKSFIISPKTYLIGTEAATAFQAGREAARSEAERRSRFSR
jgi:hypothetical protein